MPLSESLLTGLFVVVVVFAVLVILLALIKVFTGVIAVIGGRKRDDSAADSRGRG
ncbi:MAG: hypothetical protein LBB86_05155 [Oscillospiraceae bacterium]|jgi:uncharacterized membrane protein|nr:hypothetical protein [Oscillospiraceae bacterium]